ncbi:alpha/beta fold hydrolase [Hydrogenimonas thermophila]|uniref:Pimeloyl-ACP methyl ester carboxylesterase n=1 Tax=Hydrogenimonas thermophila TaxID=223786 RepID=A0A1I5PVL3_9BACT|nr:alpha/beta hydrolase [Hydrogenimonas thermophila]SFP37949.1 Pimeloyl-ACP methyl ester carboxylesterase [Hydrogenimonas thermophila]
MAVKPILYKGKTFKISYDMVNPSQKDTIIFLHGWGSNKEIMKQAFGNAFKEYKHIYIDLPGFGKSDNEIVLTTLDYANIVKEFLNAIKINPDVAAGHSFGGKVATLLNPDSLILLSSAGIVMPKPFKIRAKIAFFKLLKPFGGKFLRKFFVSQDAAGMPEHMYKTFKNVVDEDFEKVFSEFVHSALICWGKEDSATPLTAGKKIYNLMPNADFKVFEGDHYFFLKQKNEVIKTIEEFLIKRNRQ